MLDSSTSLFEVDIENYNGSSWTSGTAIPTGTSAWASGGPQTAVLAFGGRNPSLSALTIAYDGTSLSTRPSMGTARSMVAGTGTQTAAFVAGGESPSLTNATEEFTGETETVTAATLTTS